MPDPQRDKGQPGFVPTDCHRCAYAADMGREVDRLRAEIERLRGLLALIAQDTALSAETHRLMAQDFLGGFKERGER